jgi:DNA-binding transcriptional ArsR family regulator
MRDEIGVPVRPASDELHKLKCKDVEGASELLRLIGSPHRLTILCLLAERERTVSELRRIMDVRQSLVSQHLARLRESDIVEAQREANRAYYRLTDTAARDVIAVLAKHFRGGERGVAE